jgi:hypothetical protein
MRYIMDHHGIYIYVFGQGQNIDENRGARFSEKVGHWFCHLKSNLFELWSRLLLAINQRLVPPTNRQIPTTWFLDVFVPDHTMLKNHQNFHWFQWSALLGIWLSLSLWTSHLALSCFVHKNPAPLKSNGFIIIFPMLIKTWDTIRKIWRHAWHFCPKPIFWHSKICPH